MTAALAERRSSAGVDTPCASRSGRGIPARPASGVGHITGNLRTSWNCCVNSPDPAPRWHPTASLARDRPVPTGMISRARDPGARVAPRPRRGRWSGKPDGGCVHGRYPEPAGPRTGRRSFADQGRQAARAPSRPRPSGAGATSASSTTKGDPTASAPPAGRSPSRSPTRGRSFQTSTRVYSPRPRSTSPARERRRGPNARPRVPARPLRLTRRRRRGERRPGLPRRRRRRRRR